MSVTDNQPEAPEATEESAVIKELREKANRTSAAEAEASALRREMAFDRAGVPTEGPASYFRKAYDGEVTPEAIRAEAETAGLLSPAAPAVDPVEVQQATEVSSAMAGGTPPTPQRADERFREIGKDGHGSYEALVAEIEASPITNDQFARMLDPFGRGALGDT